MAKPLSSGIFLLIGEPGSGKSYKAVLEVVRAAVYRERPVYTNLPIRSRHLRYYCYLKARKRHPHRNQRTRCAKIAQLVRPISKTHFVRFCERLGRIDELAEQIAGEQGDGTDIGEMAEFRQAQIRNEATRRVADELGPARISGPDADWIPPGAELYLDELHKWFPSRGYKDEPKEILDFTSMHRHMQLKVWVLSQRLMNISLTFRSMAVELVQCRNYARVPIFGFIRVHRWFNIFNYRHYNAGDVGSHNGRLAIGARPVWSEMHWPELEGGAVYRLYSSYSHAGTLEQQLEEIEETKAAMLGEASPKRLRELQRQQQNQDAGGKMNNKEQKKMPKPMIVRVWGWWTRMAVRLVVVAVVFVLGRASVGEPDPPPAPVVAVVPAVDEVVEVETATGPRWWAGLRVTAVGPGQVWIGDREWSVGDTHEGLRLLATDAASGRSVWFDELERQVVLWDVGRPARPGRMPADLLAQLAGAAGAGEQRPSRAAAVNPATP